MNKFVVYGRDHCSFCDDALELLKEYNCDYTYWKLGEDFIREELLQLAPNAKTYPQIWVCTSCNSSTDIYLGGFTELKEYIETSINKL